MTNTYNIAAINGNVLVPVFSETGSVMAWLLSADPIGTLQELYSCMSILRGYPENTQRIPREYPENTATIKMLLAVPVSQLFTHY